MGLDAAVYCDCYEKGRVRKPPPQPELVYVDANGQVCFKWDAAGADQNAFYGWLSEACDHGPTGELISYRLGNVARIAFLRELLSASAAQFSVLLSKVIQDGTHAGDSLGLVDIEHLIPEIDCLRSVHSRDPLDDEMIRQFERQMSGLIEAARRVKKPIVF
jgi:hypothetical protein